MGVVQFADTIAGVRFLLDQHRAHNDCGNACAPIIRPPTSTRNKSNTLEESTPKMATAVLDLDED